MHAADLQLLLRFAGYAALFVQAPDAPAPPLATASSPSGYSSSPTRRASFSLLPPRASRVTSRKARPSWVAASLKPRPARSARALPLPGTGKQLKRRHGDLRELQRERPPARERLREQEPAAPAGRLPAAERPRRLSDGLSSHLQRDHDSRVSGRRRTLGWRVGSASVRGRRACVVPDLAASSQGNPAPLCLPWLLSLLSPECKWPLLL